MSAAAWRRWLLPARPSTPPLTAGLAVLAGLVSVLAASAVGRIASFFSGSVLAGFVTGLALTIRSSSAQLFGLETGGELLERLYGILTNFETHLLTLLSGGVGCLAVPWSATWRNCRRAQRHGAGDRGVWRAIWSSTGRMVGDIPAACRASGPGFLGPVLQFCLQRWASLGQLAEAYGRPELRSSTYESTPTRIYRPGAANWGGISGISIGVEPLQVGCQRPGGRNTRLPGRLRGTDGIVLVPDPLSRRSGGCPGRGRGGGCGSMVKLRRMPRFYRLSRMDLVLAICHARVLPSTLQGLLCP